MQVNDLKKLGNLFGEINKIMPLGFITSDDGKSANNLFYYLFGDRQLSSKFETMTIETIAELLVFKFGEKWQRGVINLNVADLGKSKQLIRNEKAVNTKNKTVSAENTNTETAYNSDELMTVSGNTNTQNDIDNSNNDRQVSEHYYSIDKLFNDLSLIDKNNIIDMVLNDCKSFLSLSIY